ncbi:MAG: hypothetical protein IAG10_18890 [Planctomycetaceae bacterium]|nr:hypothetical protein [Planctomycetaceae bacterium]
MLKDGLSSFSESDTADERVLNGQLPTRLRLLCVGPREPSWVGLTLQLDAEGGIEPQFRWVSTAAEALTLLRDDPFDAVLIAAADENQPQGARPGSDRANQTLARSSSSEKVQSDSFAEAASLVKAIRASGCEDPLVLLSPRISDADWLDLSCEECELLQTARMWDSPALVSVLKRAILRSEQSRQSRRLEIAQTKRMARERDETEHLLSQQRRIIDDLDARDATELTNVARQALLDCFGRAAPCRTALPPEINSYYQELLRTYVIMGSGNLGGEIAKLADLLAVAGCGPREALSLHLERVESLVGGLGNRSTRHILARADLLALELMIHLGESYRRRASE